jgi:hypothetical protein
MPVITTFGGMSARGFGFGSISKIIATGGTVTTQNISGVIYSVHTFTTSGDFVIQSPGKSKTVEAFLWGGGGGYGGFTDTSGDPSRGGRNGGSGGGGAYARNLGLGISAETLTVCVGGFGGRGSLGANNNGGAGGTGVDISGTDFYFGGTGASGTVPFSGGGGGGGGASAIIRGTTGLIVASGGGGGGGNERRSLAGNGGGGNLDGTAGADGSGGIAGASVNTNGAMGASGPHSVAGSGGGGVNGGGGGGSPGGDFTGAGAGAGGTSTAGAGTGTAVVDGVTPSGNAAGTPGDDNYTSYNDGSFGKGGGGGGSTPATVPQGTSGLVVIRYPIGTV